VISEIAIRHEGADANPSTCRLVHGLEWQMRDVDQSQRTLDIVFHQVDEIGATSYEFCRGIGRHLADSIGDIGRARVFEVDHVLASIAC
jgi:hypothetical protein